MLWAMLRKTTATPAAPSRRGRRPSLRGWCAGIFVLSLLAPLPPHGQARACSYVTKDRAPATAPVLSSAETSGSLVIGAITIKRGGRACLSDPCLGGVGVITIPVAMPQASARGVACQFAFEYKVMGGVLPAGLAGVDGPTGARCGPTSTSGLGSLFLAWNDERDEEAFSFDLGIRAVDAAGAAGPRSIVHVESPGGPVMCPEPPQAAGGCTVSRGEQSQAWPIALLLAALTVLRMRRRFR